MNAFTLMKKYQDEWTTKLTALKENVEYYMGEKEYSLKCPYCSAKIMMVLGSISNRAEYAGNCELCRNPIQVSFGVKNGEVMVKAAW